MRRVRGVDERRLAGDRDVFLEPPELEHDVERDELLRPDREPLRLVGLVAGQLRLERIGAGRNGGEAVLPHIVRRHLARDVGGLVGQRNGDPGNDAVGVSYQPSNAAGELLCVGDAGTGKQEDQAHERAGETSPTH